MRRIISYVVFLLPLWLMFGCREHGNLEKKDGEGWLSVEFLTDKSLVTRAENAKYRLEILQADGTLVAAYDNCAEMSERILLRKGTYRLVAFSGKGTGAGFEMPLYRGEQEVEIKAGTTQQVSLTCTLANVKMTVDYSDKIQQNFRNYTLEVSNGTDALTFIENDRRAGYLPVNREGTLHWILRLDNGQEEFTLNKTIKGVAARQCYNFQFDINESAGEDEGAFVGGLVVDTVLDVHHWEWVLNLKEHTDKPEIKLMGADGQLKDLNEAVVVLEEARGADVRVHVAAQATMQELMIRHRSDVVAGMGVPSDVNLIDAGEEVKTALNNAGIVWGNEDLLDKEEAIIDFSGIANRLPLGEYEFYLSVFGARNRMEMDTLRIQVVPDMEHAANEVNVMDVWAKFATLRGQWFTIKKPEGLTFEYSTDQENWIKIPEEDLRVSASNKNFTVVLSDLMPSMRYYFRTTALENGASDVVRSFETERAEQIPYSNFDLWWLKNGNSPTIGKEQDKYWDSGNEGGASVKVTPTTEEKTNVIKGSAVKLASKYVNAVVVKKFASGSLYTGQFGGMNGMTDVYLNFGIPYSCRPTTLSGYYQYQPKSVDIVNNGYDYLKGKPDSCHIYIALTDWSAPFKMDSEKLDYVDLSRKNTSIIAFGELKTDRWMDNYEKFTIQLEYRDMTRKPTYILIVASSSKYGDYFTGGDGSTLWIDEFELGFNPIE